MEGNTVMDVTKLDEQRHYTFQRYKYKDKLKFNLLYYSLEN